MSSFVSGFVGEFAKGWLVRIVSPAFVFWAAGGLAIGGHLASVGAFQSSLGFLHASDAERKWLPVLIAAAVLVAASAWLAEQLTLPVLRLLEGYWPWWLAWARNWRIARAREAAEQDREKWSELLDAGLKRDHWQWARLDDKLRHFPPSEYVLPTRLGNILCAAETRPRGKYGLDAVACWPRLWPLLPKENREDIALARAKLDDAVRLFLWSALSLVWSLWVYWLVPLSLLMMLLAYRLALAAASEFADMVEATFDTRRMLLYDTAGWPKPANPKSEPALGEALTAYFLRGSHAARPQFTFAPKASEERDARKRRKAKKRGR